MNNRLANLSKMFRIIRHDSRSGGLGPVQHASCLDRWEEHVPHMQARLCKNFQRSRSVIIVFGYGQKKKQNKKNKTKQKKTFSEIILVKRVLLR